MKITIKNKPTGIQYDDGKIYKIGKEYFMLIKIGNERFRCKYGLLNLNFGDVKFLHDTKEEISQIYNDGILVDTELIINK